MKKIVLFTMLVFVLMATLYVVTCFGSVQIHTSYEEMDTIKKMEPEYVPQYRGQKDRYNEALLRNDPEVLVAKSKPVPTPKPEPVPVVTPEPVVESEIVVKTQFCDEGDVNCSEWK